MYKAGRPYIPKPRDKIKKIKDEKEPDSEIEIIILNKKHKAAAHILKKVMKPSSSKLNEIKDEEANNISIICIFFI